ncbi:MAG: PilN domain-containing protein [Proteobacteria bacterium]|nr:PilN domain-containing protein [Pseudomonadota bacterium]
MITQQVNLYQDRFHEKKLLFSAQQILSVLVIILLGGAYGTYLIQSNLNIAKRDNYSIKQSQNKITNELNAANAELAMLLADRRMDLEITGLSREVGARKKVLAFVSANQFGSGQGFSSYLLALSNLHVENVWLNEISLADNYLKIRGSALSADLVPLYFGRFSQESVFRGNRFNIFQLERNEATDWKVDFEIATDESLDE